MDDEVWGGKQSMGALRFDMGSQLKHQLTVNVSCQRWGRVLLCGPEDYCVLAEVVADEPTL